MIIGLVDETVSRGARQCKACTTIGLDPRTVQRWKAGAVEDQRRGPKRGPKSKLSEVERKRRLSGNGAAKTHREKTNSIVIGPAGENRFIGYWSHMA